MKRLTSLVGSLSIVVASLTACNGTTNSSAVPINQLNCTNVGAQLANAQTAKSAADAKAASTKSGTPSAEAAHNAAAAADVRYSGVQAKQAALNCSATTTATSGSTYHQRLPSQCDAGFAVKYDQNAYNRLVSDGAPIGKYPTAKDAIKKLISVMKRDTRVLYVYYVGSPEQQLSPIKTEASLRGTGQDDGCYSALGQQVFASMQAELAHAQVRNVQAPSVLANTGATPGGSAFQEPVGTVTGNLSAIEIRYENGTTVWALRRCLNEGTKGALPLLPVQKPTPPPTPMHSQPPVQYCQGTYTPIPSNGLCPKDNSKNVLNNPRVAPYKKGPGTTPVGTSPGPATKPTDSSTGCSGSCPGGTSGKTVTPSNPEGGPTMAPPTTAPVTPAPVATQSPISGTVNPPGSGG